MATTDTITPDVDAGHMANLKVNDEGVEAVSFDFRFDDVINKDTHTHIHTLQQSHTNDLLRF